MNPTRWFCALSAIALTGGCATYEPRPLEPRQELTRLLAVDPAVVVHRAASADSAPLSPQAFDLQDGLNEAEVAAVALACNPDLAARRLQIGEAESSLVAAGLWPNPQLGITWLAAVTGAPGHSVEWDALIELLRPSTRVARTDAAQARVAEVKADIVAAEYALTGQVRERWLDVLAAERHVALLREDLALREQMTSLVNRQYAVGEATRLDVSLAELERAAARRDVRQAEAHVLAARLALNQLLGLPAEFALRLSDSGRPLTVTLFDDLSDDDLTQRLLAGRFELRAREAAYLQAEEQLRLAVLDQYPSVSIGPAFEHDLDGANALGLGVSVELPVFDRNQAGIAEKTAARERLRAEYVALLHQLRSDAVAARAMVRAARAEVDAQEKEILPLIEQSQNLFSQAHQARELNLLDWLTAQQRAVSARREHLDAVVAYRRALIRLDTALGTSTSSGGGAVADPPPTDPGLPPDAQSPSKTP